MTDATSRRAYGFYGDVVVFDTTFNTNRYDLTFAPMLGVNNHGQTIVLACTFLSKETTESSFKKAMPGGEPKTIITEVQLSNKYMKDPKRVRCKGRSKGVTGAKEKAMKRGIRHCRSVDTLDITVEQRRINSNTS
ncbi:Protein kinase superfamily protein [Prunus dulcis]|uniref:Protein kinase superfamily protein n=1 Tax=Prunus dulcis TaxID=3755 RepID=A0A4Y1QYI2_PRUDU|nr:Protein kinase superfamily protein [Prunus dulcis]